MPTQAETTIALARRAIGMVKTLPEMAEGIEDWSQRDFLDAINEIEQVISDIIIHNGGVYVSGAWA